MNQRQNLPTLEQLRQDAEELEQHRQKKMAEQFPEESESDEDDDGEGQGEQTEKDELDDLLDEVGGSAAAPKISLQVVPSALAALTGPKEPAPKASRKKKAENKVEEEDTGGAPAQIGDAVVFG